MAARAIEGYGAIGRSYTTPVVRALFSVYLAGRMIATAVSVNGMFTLYKTAKEFARQLPDKGPMPGCLQLDASTDDRSILPGDPSLPATKKLV